MSIHSAGKGGERRDPAISEQTGALCAVGERYTRWLWEVADEVCRACVVVARGAGAFLSARLAARYGLRVAPIWLADAVLFRATARPAADDLAGAGRGPRWLRVVAAPETGRVARPDGTLSKR
jgi:hypothetical protein